MYKPITVNVKDTANQIKNVLEESQLHPVIKYQIIQDIYSEVANELRSTAVEEEQEYRNQQLEKEGEGK